MPIGSCAAWPPTASPPSLTPWWTPPRRNVLLSNAGHPPPILVEAAASTSLLRGGLSLPLGAPAEPVQREQVDYSVAPGARLFLYTDGLIEDRQGGLDHGLELLMDALCAASGGPEELCQRGLAVRRGARDDDVCVLCAASTTPEEPTQAGIL